MFRCTECKLEYKTKPDYCKCGNDEFDEFEILNTQHQNNQEKITFPDELFNKKLLPIAFLILCIIFAIIPWLFKSNSVEKNQTEDKKIISQNIPDIESIWENSPKAPSKKQEERQIEPKISKQPKPQTQNTLLQNTTSVQNSKTKAAATPKKVQPKPKQTNSIPQNSADKNKPKSSTQVKTQNTNQTKPTTAQSNSQTIQQPPPQPKPQPPKMNAQEFLEYKGQIRTALLGKLNITAIQGSGDCAVEFSLDNSGKLINRNFIYKSQNKSLNDEVYLMLMRLPYFKTPPANYNGEKIKLKFYINNGYYEITFI